MSIAILSNMWLLRRLHDISKVKLICHTQGRISKANMPASISNKVQTELFAIMLDGTEKPVGQQM